MFSVWQLKLNSFTGEEWCGRAWGGWDQGSCSAQAACIYVFNVFAQLKGNFPLGVFLASSKALKPSSKTPSPAACVSIQRPLPLIPRARSASSTWQADDARAQQPSMQVLPGWRLPTTSASAGHRGTTLAAGTFQGLFLHGSSSDCIRSCAQG